MNERPAEMYRNGRQEIEEFEPGELSFRAFRECHLVGSFLPATAFSFPDISVNRSRFSEPAWILFDHPGCGIVSVVTEDIPSMITSGDGRVFNFGVRHVPIDDNYSHSEIQIYFDSVHYQSEVPRFVKKMFRLRVFAHAQIHRMPD